jgi:hypothetical protein
MRIEKCKLAESTKIMIRIEEHNCETLSKLRTFN